MPDDTPPPPPPGPARTVERIVVEALLVALAGAFVLALTWELGELHIGWPLAIIIWIAGAPLLEILRVLGARR